MFARVAAFAIAALLIVAPPSSCGRTGVQAARTATDTTIGATADAKISEANPSGTNLPDASFATAGTRPGDLPQDNPATQPRHATLNPPVARATPREPFGLNTMPWFSGDIFEKWTRVNAAVNADRNVLARCRKDMAHCPPEARKFLAVIATGRAQTGRGRVGVINRAVNLAIEHMSDLQQWGVDEHWSPPLETFATGRGDCEDYAIAKYVALIEAGVPTDDVRLVIVRDQAANDGHAIAAVHLDDGWVLLDNRWLTLADAGRVQRMVPQFVIGQDGVRTYLRTPANTAALASAPLAN